MNKLSEEMNTKIRVTIEEGMADPNVGKKYLKTRKRILKNTDRELTPLEASELKHLKEALKPKLSKKFIIITGGSLLTVAGIATAVGVHIYKSKSDDTLSLSDALEDMDASEEATQLVLRELGLSDLKSGKDLMTVFDDSEDSDASIKDLLSYPDPSNTDPLSPKEIADQLGMSERYERLLSLEANGLISRSGEIALNVLRTLSRRELPGVMEELDPSEPYDPSAYDSDRLYN